jgi:UDP-2,4-diacetamido-2,4,6-trideoxy-beta-L-altropyranose hydrolase
MKVVFRVDASLQIGSGHFMRCLTLAEALRVNGVQCHFICRAHAGNLLGLILHSGFGFSELPLEILRSHPKKQVVIDYPKVNEHAQWLGCDWQNDAEQTRAIVEKLQPDLLVVDHYALDQQWEFVLRPYCKKLFVIDDLADRPHQCDFLLDQNLGRLPQDYSKLVPSHCKVLAGPQYALLRQEFSKLRAYSLQRRQQPTLKHLLISMGGVDLPNASGQVLQALKDCILPKDCHVSLVMGHQAPWLTKVRAQAQDMPWKTEVLVNISDMAQCMADSDLAIGAAGSTSWERCCLGLPTLLTVLAKNQENAASYLELAGAAYCLSLDVQLNQRLRDRIQYLLNQSDGLNRMTNNASRITDGMGVERVITEIQKSFMQ